MSQVNLFDIEGAHPQIPTSFTTDAGTAIPIANNLEILGVNGVTTTGAGKTVTVHGITATAGANAGLATIGVASFDSADFSVVGGFVSLAGGGLAIDSIGIDASTAPGTNPTVPTAAGLINMNGVLVGPHNIPLRTNATVANAIRLEIQQTNTSAVSDSTVNGVAHFISSQFSVDPNGLVSLAGGGQAIDSIAVQTGTSPVIPTVAGLITINGAVVAAGTNPVRSDGTGANTLAIEVQISQAIASTDATKIGLCNFDKVDFTVDANGFVVSTYSKSFLFGGM